MPKLSREDLKAAAKQYEESIDVGGDSFDQFDCVDGPHDGIVTDIGAILLESGKSEGSILTYIQYKIVGGDSDGNSVRSTYLIPGPDLNATLIRLKKSRKEEDQAQLRKMLTGTRMIIGDYRRLTGKEKEWTIPTLLEAIGDDSIKSEIVGIEVRFDASHTTVGERTYTNIRLRFADRPLVGQQPDGEEMPPLSKSRSAPKRRTPVRRPVQKRKKK